MCERSRRCSTPVRARRDRTTPTDIRWNKTLPQRTLCAKAFDDVRWSTTLAETTSEPTPQETRGQRARRTRRRAGLYAWVFVLAALLIVLVALAVQNTGPVEVSWVFGTGQVPLVWLIIFAAILGWLVGIVTGTVIRHSTRRR